MAIDANVNANAAGDQAFSFIGAAAFSGSAGELRTVQRNGVHVVEGDVDGVGGADFRIELGGRRALAADDFVL